MNQPDNVLYTARTHTTGGRDGASRSSDGRLDVKLSSPGTAGAGAGARAGGIRISSGGSS